MPFQVIHPRDFPQHFGIPRPSRSTLARWAREKGFPRSLAVPRGFYRFDEVCAWFAARNEPSEKYGNTHCRPERMRAGKSKSSEGGAQQSEATHASA